MQRLTRWSISICYVLLLYLFWVKNKQENCHYEAHQGKSPVDDSTREKCSISASAHHNSFSLGYLLSASLALAFTWYLLSEKIKPKLPRCCSPDITQEEQGCCCSSSFDYSVSGLSSPNDSPLEWWQSSIFHSYIWASNLHRLYGFISWIPENTM